MILVGVDKLQWLLLGTFIAMLMVIPVFGWLTRRLTRARFILASYLFFGGCLVVFYFLFASDNISKPIASAFFIWVNVFNLFVVSVFWSFMSDIYTEDQSRRLFAFIAAGGTTGALTGPVVTGLFVEHLGPGNLFLISAGILMVAIYCSHRLARWSRQYGAGTTAAHSQDGTEKIKGGLWDGVKLVVGSRYLMGVCAIVLLYTLLATFLSIQQAELVEATFDNSVQRTRLFASVDFAANFITLVFQIFVTSHLVKKFGLHWSLAFLPVVLILGFLAIAFMPVLAVMVVIQVIRRAGNYAIAKPAREMLFVVLRREEKYKAKNFIDTAVHRSGDMVSAWIYKALQSIGLDAQGIAAISAGLAVVWATTAYKVGRQYQSLAENENHDKH